MLHRNMGSAFWNAVDYEYDQDAFLFSVELIFWIILESCFIAHLTIL